MSQHHRITYVQVDAFEEEELELDRVMGKVPAEEMHEVLESDWGKNAGWSRDEKGAGYCLRLPHGVSMREPDRGPTIRGPPPLSRTSRSGARVSS